MKNSIALQKRGISDVTRVIKRINGAEITREVSAHFRSVNCVSDAS